MPLLMLYITIGVADDLRRVNATLYGRADACRRLLR